MTKKRLKNEGKKIVLFCNKNLKNIETFFEITKNWDGKFELEIKSKIKKDKEIITRKGKDASNNSNNIKTNLQQSQFLEFASSLCHIHINLNLKITELAEIDLKYTGLTLFLKQLAKIDTFLENYLVFINYEKEQFASKLLGLKQILYFKYLVINNSSILPVPSETVCNSIYNLQEFAFNTSLEIDVLNDKISLISHINNNNSQDNFFNLFYKEDLEKNHHCLISFKGCKIEIKDEEVNLLLAQSPTLPTSSLLLILSPFSCFYSEEELDFLNEEEKIKRLFPAELKQLLNTRTIFVSFNYCKNLAEFLIVVASYFNENNLSSLEINRLAYYFANHFNYENGNSARKILAKLKYQSQEPFWNHFSKYEKQEESKPNDFAIAKNLLDCWIVYETIFKKILHVYSNMQAKFIYDAEWCVQLMNRFLDSNRNKIEKDIVKFEKQPAKIQVAKK